MVHGPNTKGTSTNQPNEYLLIHHGHPKLPSHSDDTTKALVFFSFLIVITLNAVDEECGGSTVSIYVNRECQVESSKSHALSRPQWSSLVCGCQLFRYAMSPIPKSTTPSMDA